LTVRAGKCRRGQARKICAECHEKTESISKSMAWLGLAWLDSDCKNPRQCAQGISATLTTRRHSCCSAALDTISPVSVAVLLGGQASLWRQSSRWTTSPMRTCSTPVSVLKHCRSGSPGGNKPVGHQNKPRWGSVTGLWHGWRHKSRHPCVGQRGPRQIQTQRIVQRRTEAQCGVKHPGFVMPGIHHHRLKALLLRKRQRHLQRKRQRR